MGSSILGLKIRPEIVSWPFLRMRTKSGQNGPKRRGINQQAGILLGLTSPALYVVWQC